LDNYDTCFGNKLKMNNIRGIIRFDYLYFFYYYYNLTELTATSFKINIY